MFFISKNVASGIKALREREHVNRELAAIRAMPCFEVYANAIAEGLDHRAARKHPPRVPHEDEPSNDAAG